MTSADRSQAQPGVRTSADVGTPIALESNGARGGSTDGTLATLEFPAALELVAWHAVGPLGADAVRTRHPSDDVAWVDAEMTDVAEAAALARRDQGIVAEAVPDLRSPLARLRITGSVLEGVDLLAIRRTLVAARLVVGELRRVAEHAPRAALRAEPLTERAVERRLELAFDDDGQLLDSASPGLAAARSEVRAARARLIQRLESILRSLGGDESVTVRDGRYVIPVPRDLRGRPDGILHGESASGATLYLEPSSAIPLGNGLRQAEDREQREVLQVYRDLTELLRPERDRIAALHRMCVAVDDLAARARYAAAVDGHRPAVTAAPGDLLLLNARHPLLFAPAEPLGLPAAEPPSRRAAESPSQRTVIPFDLDLPAPERTLLVSGPNTGGKSVLLKAIGLISAMVQSGIIPPIGPESRLPVFRACFADIGDRQSIAESLSTFSAHVALLRRILEEADNRSLVLLDEIGSGTDPAEGAALAGAVLLALTRRGSVTVATTHLGALKQLASRAPGVVNASLQFDAATLQPTYRFLKGVPGRSYGLAIARRLGLPEAVLNEAEAQVPEAERSLDALLAAVETRERNQQQRERELESLRAEAEWQKARLELQATEQAAREAELRRRERDAERNAREQSRSFLLEARQRVEEAIAKAREATDDAGAREARRLVEEAARVEAEALGRGRQTDRRTDGPSSGLAVGQRVKLDSGTVGQLEELRADGDALVRIGGVKVIVSAGTLSPANERSPKDGKVVNPSVRPTVRPTDSSPLEIDLRGLTGDEAEQAVVSAIDAAMLAEHPFLRIIHGKGTGVVRERVQQVAQRDRRIKKFAFAPGNQGGSGVTIVEFEA